MRRSSEQVRLADYSRIMISGASGSGKTTLARRLATSMDLHYIDMDLINHLPGWVDTPMDQAEPIMRAEMARERWVTDGNYARLRPITLPRAELVIWLDYPFWLVYRQLFRRTLSRCLRREEVFPGCVELFWHSFFSPDGIMWWLVKTHKRRHQQLAEVEGDPAWGHVVIVGFRGPEELERWLRAQAL